MRVLAGVSPDTLEAMEANNPERAHRVKTDKFDGEIAVFVKDFQNDHGEPSSADYFKHPDRRSRSWSIQVRGVFNANSFAKLHIPAVSLQAPCPIGRFLSETVTGDDILFGNVFDRPLDLPYGSGAVLRLMEKKDPTLEQDLKCEKPWAL